jgi:hypothetical protein
MIYPKHRVQSRTHMDHLTAVRLQRGTEHLHRLGARAIAELLAEVGDRIDGTPCIISLLTDYERRVTPEMLHVTGGDQFPPRLRAVPR